MDVSGIEKQRLQFCKIWDPNLTKESCVLSSFIVVVWVEEWKNITFQNSKDFPNDIRIEWHSIEADNWTVNLDTCVPISGF